MTLDLTAIREMAVRAKEMAEKASKGPWTRRPVSVCYPRATNRQDNHNWNLIDGMETCTGEAHRGTAPYPDPFYIALPDAEFVASSRTVVPELADAVLKLLEENERLQTEIKRLHDLHYKRTKDSEVIISERDALKAENAKLRAVAEAALEVCSDLNGRALPVRQEHIWNLSAALAALEEKP